ncbi:MAG: hypothetical protein A2020_01160 [Lentisphaerae bacterium GWF2_45_14]|nr:MAG: hypothetical protein A2020_01160 [Lentisphaerae bacterium GWF2_45_14]
MFKQFLKKPTMTGSMWPSSSFLSKKIIDSEHIRAACSVVELGPGTGAVTPHIIESIRKETKFFTIELNAEMIPVFKSRFPKVKIYNDSAANLPGILKDEGLESVDVVISGLPWATFPERLQDQLLDAIVESLPKGGFFTTYGYVQGTFLPGAKNFKRKLSKHFSHVDKSPIIWLNLPPAFVYRCVK